ncbi:MAG: RNA polymerase subunit sigma-24 [Rhodopirellula bahusiensis]|uniref:RNA polymerase subunit sigma-24 n=2 Tax=Rhodopirellula bahusiensis TaxID=2014065 RepID=UPI00329A67E6
MGVVGMASDVQKLAMQGRRSTPEEVAELEKKVADQPADIDSRTKLLGYYFLCRREQPGAEETHQRHVLWLIENAPEAEIMGTPFVTIDRILQPDAYDTAKKAWIKATDDLSESPAVLRHAARYFLLHDRDLSETLLQRGKRLAPNDPEWSSAVGQLYSLGMISLSEGPERKDLAIKSFGEFQSAYRLSGPMEQEFLLQSLAKVAFEAGDIDAAATYAKEMLQVAESGRNRGNHLHHGNLILGRVALFNGDVEEAKSYLLRAGQTPGSPQLKSFGPNMGLAKALLEVGQKNVVLEYFELCEEFWEMSRGRLNQWADLVKADRVPEFGGNLAY